MDSVAASSGMVGAGAQGGPSFAMGPKAAKGPEDLMPQCPPDLGPRPLSLQGGREPGSGARVPGTVLRGEMKQRHSREDTGSWCSHLRADAEEPTGQDTGPHSGLAEACLRQRAGSRHNSSASR